MIFVVASNGDYINSYLYELLLCQCTLNTVSRVCIAVQSNHIRINRQRVHSRPIVIALANTDPFIRVCWVHLTYTMITGFAKAIMVYIIIQYIVTIPNPRCPFTDKYSINVLGYGTRNYMVLTNLQSN